ncbi:hypothetical protein WJ0W_006812 [Paenibacillus melissococcoides]|uniref:Uncharacterized protein n=1 Tax=Paenibacillus melissococcoides TaxID=2912268 RepID=A0ABN8UEI0_9BACL|nr:MULTISPECIES: hypothetical protein [Paenibacillus]MEB9895829.1 hypothetical protein [Bacillus cereus]CAH8249627.1 hypothetical protein WJ0W_006812 [Paenibacillus melissococcoides]CAH8721418.1 hypothetical protein WDD9_006283 [Paenibacillus melissococcoides]CAH8721802.1 hypothetical protein HTL2_006543 [Paenibacillus melissococcoides]
MGRTSASKEPNSSPSAVDPPRSPFQAIGGCRIDDPVLDIVRRLIDADEE